MKVQKASDYSYSVNFSARLRLNDRTFLKGTGLESEKTLMDSMFNENKLVRALNDFSIFMKNEILFKYFDKPKNKLNEKLAGLQIGAVLCARKFADRLFLFDNNKAVNRICANLQKFAPETPEYVEELAKIGNTIPSKFIDINIEDKILEKLAKSDDASIFVLNHPNYNKDKFVYMIINSLLSKLYMAEGKQATCPRPKILVSQNMLKIVHEKIGAIYKNMGLTPVDASMQHKNKRFNQEAMTKLTQEFIANKSNIFIFPEGNNSVYVDKPLREKIRPGVANFVIKSLDKKDSVRVVPIGIKYTNEKNSLGKVFINQPLIFTKENSKKEHILDLVSESIQKSVDEAAKL